MVNGNNFPKAILVDNIRSATHIRGMVLMGGLLLASATLAEMTIDSTLKEQLSAQRQGVQVQKRIDKLDDQTRAMLDEFHSGSLRLEDLTIYNAQMDRLIGCDLNLKPPQQKERQRDLFFAKTASIFEPSKLMPVNLKCQPHRVVSSAYRQDKIAVL